TSVGRPLEPLQMYVVSDALTSPGSRTPFMFASTPVSSLVPPLAQCAPGGSGVVATSAVPPVSPVQPANKTAATAPASRIRPILLALCITSSIKPFVPTRPSEMTGRAHPVAADLRVVVVQKPRRGMWVAADPADAVAAHAVGSRALVVARRAARDVAPRRLAMEIPRSRDGPPERMRITRILRGRRQILGLMTARAEIVPMALAAGGLVAGGLDRVPSEEVIAVDEGRVDRLGELDLDPGRHGPGVAVRAVRLVVALRAVPGGAARVGAVARDVISLVREIGQGLERDAVQRRMAPRALGLRVRLRVLVAAQAVAHLGHGVHRGERLREPLVTGRAVLLDALDVLLVAHLHQALGERALRGVLDVRVAE